MLYSQRDFYQVRTDDSIARDKIVLMSNQLKELEKLGPKLKGIGKRPYAILQLGD